MSFFLRWLNLSKDRRPVGLRPHREVELSTTYDAAYDSVIDAVERALGAYVVTNDRIGGTIEAAFGVVNNERVRCTVERTAHDSTTVRVEAFFPVGRPVPPRSDAVEALANMLERGP